MLPGLMVPAGYSVLRVSCPGLAGQGGKGRPEERPAGNGRVPALLLHLL